MSEFRGQEVVLSKDGKVFYGTEWWREPVDEPPLITAAGSTWYRHVWERQGWSIEDDI